MNSLKSLAHAAHQSLVAYTPKRSHVYELLAASCGFKSYAALTATHLLYSGAYRSRHTRTTAMAAVQKRGRELGYLNPVPLSEVLVDFLDEHEIGCVALSALIEALEPDAEYSEGDDEEGDDEEGADGFLAEPALLISQLQQWAQDDLADAHYALALIYLALATDEESSGSEHWWRQGQQGVVLSQVQQEWADAYAEQRGHASRSHAHLQQAVRLGHGPARLMLAEQNGDAAIFDESIGRTNFSPRRMAALAEQLGRSEEADRWRSRAAAAGDVEIMRELLEDEAGTLEQRWVWVYLGELMGSDLLASQHRAIHEDGSDYDDDVGGPIVVTGREALSLPPLPDDLDRVARAESRRLFALVSVAAGEGEGSDSGSDV